MTWEFDHETGEDIPPELTDHWDMRDKVAIRNERIALMDHKENGNVIDKMKERLKYKLARLETLKVEVKFLRELIEELEK